MDLFLTIGLGGLILALVYFMISEHLNYFKKRNFPHLEMSVSELAVNVLLTLCKMLSAEKIVNDVYKRTKGFSLLGSQTIMIRDPELVSLVTIKDFSHFVDRPLPGGSDDGDLMTGGILGVKGDAWRWQRHKLAPTFTSGKLKSMFSQITGCSDDVISYIGKGKGPVNIKSLTSCYSLNVIGSTAFGLNVNAEKNIDGVENKFIEMSRRLFAPTYKQLFAFLMVTALPRLSKKFGICLLDEEMDQFFEEFTDRIIAANSFVFVAGGSESTASAIAFALYELAANPNIQVRLRNEIEKANPNKEVEFSALNAVPYFDQVIDETLRKYPFFGTITRACVEDYPIPGTKNILKKGVKLVIPLGAIQMNPEYFPDSERFNPDWFQDRDSIVKGSYLPFGMGPRFCISMRLAIMEIKVFIAKVLMFYNVKLSSKTKQPLKMENSVFKQVKGGLWLEFEPRK